MVKINASMANPSEDRRQSSMFPGGSMVDQEPHFGGDLRNLLTPT